MQVLSTTGLAPDILGPLGTLDEDEHGNEHLVVASAADDDGGRASNVPSPHNSSSSRLEFRDILN